MNRVSILVVEDQHGLRTLLEKLLAQEGHRVTAVSSGEEALRAAEGQDFDALVVDMQLPGMGGLAVLDRLRRRNGRLAAIVLTGQGTVEQAVQAMKAGASEFLAKPCDLGLVPGLVARALESRPNSECPASGSPDRGRELSDQLIGESEDMRALRSLIGRVADSDSTVLVQGESGTGKEVLARSLHRLSDRRNDVLIPVNCGAIPEALLESELFGHEKGAFTGAFTARIGRFEAAHGGTLFLDEIGEMSVQLQVKLLRVLQERCFERVGGTRSIKVDVRIIAATNQDLEQAVAQGRFRKDLFYRLNVIPVTVPPLRSRRADVPRLVDHFLGTFNRTRRAAMTGVHPEAMACLTNYDWPGNVRELENLVERLVVLKRHGVVEASDLPEKFIRASPTAAAPATPPAAVFHTTGIHLMRELECYENRLILDALRQAKGITSRAAQLLHVNRTTLVEKLKRKGLDAKLAHTAGS